MITGHSAYVEFFRTACVKHVDILHGVTNDHFARITLTYDPILGTAAQIREFVGGKKFKLKEPIVLLASYVARYADDRSDNVVKVLAGALIILKKVDSGNFNKEEAVFDATEKIGSELMGYTAEKLDTDNTSQWLEWQRVSNERLSNVDGYSGTRFEFEIIGPAFEEIKWVPGQFGE
jgi:hypothetical protein